MPLLESLRHHTRARHEALHFHPLLSSLSNDSLTLAGFHHILLAFEAYYRRAEAACAVELPDDVPNAPVLAWLESDLAQHRLDSWAGRLGIDLPAVDTPSKAAGYLYMKQGSTLGGSVISKHLERRLSLVPRIDQWFFAGYGHENGAKWKQFTGWLDDNDFDETEAVATATGCFDAVAAFCDQVADKIGDLDREMHAAHV